MPFQFRKEAIEEDLNSNFPSQGQGNPPLYYSLSEVVVPTYSINNVAEGTSLPENLQTAWDFSTGSVQKTSAGATTFISNPGFWQIDLTVSANTSTSDRGADISLSDGLTSKKIWDFGSEATGGTTAATSSFESKFVVFVRSGDDVVVTGDANLYLAIWYRQIADINGNLINPLGFSFA